MTRFSLLLGLTIGAICTSLAAPGFAQTLRRKIEPTRQTGGYIPLSTQIIYDTDTDKDEATLAFLDNGKLRTIDGRIETLNKKADHLRIREQGLVEQYQPVRHINDVSGDLYVRQSCFPGECDTAGLCQSVQGQGRLRRKLTVTTRCRRPLRLQHCLEYLRHGLSSNALKSYISGSVS